MSFTAPGIKGVVTDFMDATPSATVAFQAVSAPGSWLDVKSGVKQGSVLGLLF